MKHSLYLRILVAVCALLVTLIIPPGCSGVNGPDTNDPAYVEQLSICLSDHGACLYGASWCPYTRQQIADFGEYIANIDYVECTQQPSTCSNAGITGYPTWIIDGRVYEGYYDLPTLAKIVGFRS